MELPLPRRALKDLSQQRYTFCQKPVTVLVPRLNFSGVSRSRRSPQHRPLQHGYYFRFPFYSFTKTSFSIESGALVTFCCLIRYGLKSSALEGLLFLGSRTKFTTRAIKLDVCSHSKRPRASANATNSRRVRGSGFTPAIPAKCQMRSSTLRGLCRFLHRKWDLPKVPSTPVCFSVRNGGWRPGSCETPGASLRGKNQ